MQSLEDRVQELIKLAYSAGHNPQPALDAAGDHEPSKVIRLAGLLGVSPELALNRYVSLNEALGAATSKLKRAVV